MILLVIVTSIRQRPRRQRWPKIHRIGNGLMWAAAVFYGYRVVTDQAIISSLVFIAIRGIEVATSVAVPLLPDADLDVVRRTEPAFWLSCISATLVVPNLALIYLASRRRTVARRRRLWCALFVLTFATMTAAVLYNCLAALPAAAPMMMEHAIGGGQRRLLLVGLPLLLILTTGAAYRWSVCDREQIDENPKEGGPPMFLHERPVILSLLAGTVLYEVWETGDPADTLYFLVEWGPGPMLLALLYVSVQKAVAGIRCDLRHSPPRALPMKRFILLWCALAVTTAVAIPALATWGFCYWLSPWYLAALKSIRWAWCSTSCGFRPSSELLGPHL